MPKKKVNIGPCSVHNCTKNSKDFRRLSDSAVRKASAAGTLQQYSYLQTGQQICLPHYMIIVEPNHGNKIVVESSESDNENVASGNTLYLKSK
jgi:hypothetical protein